MNPTWRVTALVTLLAFCNASAADEPPAHPAYDKEDAAIAVLQRANTAIRALPGIAFHASYFGTHTSRGRLGADVLLRRDDSLDDAMGTIAYRVRADVVAQDPPYSHGTLPERYTLLDGPDRAALIDHAERAVTYANGQSRYALNIGGVVTLIPPQYLRPEPLTMEIDDSIGARHLGSEVVDGVETEVVWLKFEDTSGFGEQLLYFGSDDGLLRKVVFTAPRVVVSERTESSPEATYPTIHFELTLTELRVVREIDDARFTAAHEGYREVVFDDLPVVGARMPDWTLSNAAGGTVSAADLRGQVAYLFFWASWCPVCHLYLPEVQRIHEDFDDVRVIAINAFDRDDALQYIRELGYTFEVALDGDRLLVDQLRFIGQPALVVVDRDGIIRHRELAPRRDKAGEVRAMLSGLVDSR